ncbi:MAG: aspartate kinase [Christensenellaceae bacterium]|jgi:aspartate kinase|nr:aspartate kinase [Christensenellaceae bacterium]
MIKVVKFGGSSLADAAQFQKVKDLVQADEKRAVVVVSAPGKRFGDDNKVTDLLYLCHAHLQYGVSYEAIFSMIEERFNEIKRGCGLKTNLGAEFALIRSNMKKNMSIDYLASRGEYLTGKLMADYLGYTFVDATQWVSFGYDGKLDMEKTNAQLAAIFEKTNKLVLPGFYGALPDGGVKVMTRGGSDITGSLAAAAVNAEVYENWTDVSGILMADPRIVENPKPIAHITYSELRELAYMGANVLHEEAVFPVLHKDIPINIRNTNEPAAPGTFIQQHFSKESREERKRFITGISGRKDYSIITLHKHHLIAEVGMIRKVLSVLEKYKVPIEQTPGGIDSFSVVVTTEKITPVLYDVIAEIKQQCDPDSITVTEGISLIAVVGRKMVSIPGVSGKMFGALGENGINIRLIDQGPDEINIIVGVENKDFEQAIRVLYNKFIVGGEEE